MRRLVGTIYHFNFHSSQREFSEYYSRRKLYTTQKSHITIPKPFWSNIHEFKVKTRIAKKKWIMRGLLEILCNSFLSFPLYSVTKNKKGPFKVCARTINLEHQMLYINHVKSVVAKCLFLDFFVLRAQCGTVM